MRRKFALLLLNLVVLFSILESKNNAYILLQEESYIDLFMDLFLPEKGELFRGINFEFTIDEIKDIEESRATVSLLEDPGDNTITYTTDMGLEVLNFADITYFFDKDGLYDIFVETYFIDRETESALYDLTISYFTEIYGEGKLADDGFLEFEDEIYDGLIGVKKIDDLENTYGFYIIFEDMLF